jgi:hypothetical protein
MPLPEMEDHGKIREAFSHFDISMTTRIINRVRNAEFARIEPLLTKDFSHENARHKAGHNIVSS